MSAARWFGLGSRLALPALLCLIVWASAASSRAADDKKQAAPPAAVPPAIVPPAAVQSVTITVRVTGLFAPDRVDDLRAVLAEKLPDVKLDKISYETTEAQFTFDGKKLFPGAKPEQILERLDNLVRTHSAGTFGVRPPTTVARAKLTTVEIPVVGLDCKGCCLAAYEAIAKIDGVERATASFLPADGKITALIDPAKTNRAALEAALTQKRVELKTPAKPAK